MPESDVVVIGASVAGLFAAAAAAGAGRRVTVLERDLLPESARTRSGVPQGPQPHVFLYRGLLAAEELLPGLGQELRAAGAVPTDTGDLAWLGDVGWSISGVKAFEVLSMTRPLFEELVRRRVEAIDGVTIRCGVRVSGLRRRDSGWEVRTADGEEVGAALVIDASGRGSRLPQWLTAIGLPSGRITEIDAGIGYATRVYAAGPTLPELAGVVVLVTPEGRTGGLALPVEGGRWLVSAIGAGDRRPPRDVVGYQDFLAGLRDPAVAQLAARCEPLSEVAVHRQTGNRRHHYESERRWPAGLLVVGDALCAFNPVYGQGLTVAACEALALRRALLRWPASPRRVSRLSPERALLREFAAVGAVPWAIATGQDTRYPGLNAGRTLVQRLTDSWSTQVTLLGTHGNLRAITTFGRVYHLMAPPRQLLHPALLLAAVRARLLGYPGPAAPRPAALDALGPVDSQPAAGHSFASGDSASVSQP